MDIELPGITKPKIVTPENKRWNAATLASLLMDILQTSTYCS
jgi:cell division protein FtsI (penicillin-binding protein 3)